MPKIRFVRGVVWNGEPQSPGTEADVSDHEARVLCDGYKDAVRLDGEPPKLTGMTVREQVETRDPVAEHRDPATKPVGMTTANLQPRRRS